MKITKWKNLSNGASGAIDLDRYPISAISRKINGFTSHRAGYPSFHTIVVAPDEEPEVRDFALSRKAVCLHLDIDLKKVDRRASENMLNAAFGDAAEQSETLFIFGFEKLADGKATKNKWYLLKMLMYYGARHFKETDQIFFISTKPYVHNLNPPDVMWFFGRLNVIKDYAQESESC